ncbi:hexose kinase [Acerihabitans arboris]|uniref:Phosphofructokinase n=1 Tax=Acerihabitans arboris TaxID=2691583 RepID=A0A845SN15_9GAMM|nr:hexose kinase [Acerihabitans arboris]NDL64314.1 hexose kinase [Acerihabitans arboris]
MILTVTMNPSVDISYPLEILKINSVNRIANVRKEAGGKGLNVTRVIKQAQEEVIATGLIGGVLGDYIVKRLDAINIKHQFFDIAQESRNCIAILHEGNQTEILEQGPTISVEEGTAFISKFSVLTDIAKVITISGSLPSGLEKDFYRKLIDISNKKNKKVLLDCSGKCLEIATSGPWLPYLIKPNKEEIEQLTGMSLDTGSIKSFVEMIDTHKSLYEIPWIVVSLGKEGAFAKVGGHYFAVAIPKIKVINPVGSGDATVAGLAIGINNIETPENTLKRAMAFGILNAMEAKTGYINMIKYTDIFSQVKVYPYFTR